jgi:hypothetical protein
MIFAAAQQAALSGDVFRLLRNRTMIGGKGRAFRWSASFF